MSAVGSGSCPTTASSPSVHDSLLAFALSTHLYPLGVGEAGDFDACGVFGAKQVVHVQATANAVICLRPLTSVPPGSTSHSRQRHLAPVSKHTPSVRIRSPTLTRLIAIPLANLSHRQLLHRLQRPFLRFARMCSRHGTIRLVRTYASMPTISLANHVAGHVAARRVCRLPRRLRVDGARTRDRGSPHSDR